MNRDIRKGDFILIIDSMEYHYLEIGYISNIECDIDGNIEFYEVTFKSGVVKYVAWELRNVCNILTFSDR